MWWADTFFVWSHLVFLNTVTVIKINIKVKLRRVWVHLGLHKKEIWPKLWHILFRFGPVTFDLISLNQVLLWYQTQSLSYATISHFTLRLVWHASWNLACPNWRISEVWPCWGDGFFPLWGQIPLVHPTAINSMEKIMCLQHTVIEPV